MEKLTDEQQEELSVKLKRKLRDDNCEFDRWCDENLNENEKHELHNRRYSNFLNVDFEIAIKDNKNGKKRLEELAKEFIKLDSSLSVIRHEDENYEYCGEFDYVKSWLVLEFNTFVGGNDNENSLINRFCHLIKLLSQKHKDLIKNADCKLFDIGISAGESEFYTYRSDNRDSTITSDTLALVAECGCDIGLTIYPNDIENYSEPISKQNLKDASNINNITRKELRK